VHIRAQYIADGEARHKAQAEMEAFHEERRSQEGLIR
jgi:hypothetical protein